MRIVVLPPQGVTFSQDSAWNALLTGLVDRGHDVQGYGYRGGDIDALVSLNDQPDARELLGRVDRGNACVIVLEPRVTSPTMYRSGALGRYGLRFAASPVWARALDAIPFPWPQDLDAVGPLKISQSAPPFVASLINADKRSAVGGSLYGLRREVIAAFDGADVPLAVFGPGWDAPVAVRLRQGVRATAKALHARVKPHLREALARPGIRPSHAQGAVAEKSEAFAVAPVSIIIENSADYVSEKLVDAIVAGVVPVYVGPSLSAFGLPEELAVPSPPTADGVLDTVRSMSAQRADEVRLAGRAWISSDSAKDHEIRAVLRTLGQSIADRLNSP